MGSYRIILKKDSINCDGNKSTNFIIYEGEKYDLKLLYFEGFQSCQYSVFPG